MAVKPHALSRQPVKIGRVALRDEVGPQPIPYHQHHDTAAAAMRSGGVLRAAGHGHEYEKYRENFGQPSSGEHLIGHQSGPRPTVSIALQ